MTRAAKGAIVTERNGDVFLKNVRRDKGGRSVVRRKKIACGIAHIVGGEATRAAERVPVRIVELGSASARKAARKKKPPPVTSIPTTVRERFHMNHTEFSGGSYVDTIKPAYLDTTSRIPQILRKAKARTGSHVEQFQRDFETLTSALRSPKMEVSVGGNVQPIPISQIQAQDRLSEFQEMHPESYLINRLVLVDGVDPRQIPVPNVLKKKGGINKMIQRAVGDLADFYTPRKTRPDRSLIAFAKMVEDERRAYEAWRA